MTGDERIAEDLLARTFVRVFGEQLSPDGNAVDEAFLAVLREHIPIGACSLQLSEISLASSVAQGNVLRTDLESALLDLPATERLIYLLRDVEGYAPDRIAALLALSQLQIKLALMAARLRLCELLSERYEQRSAA